MVTDYLLVPGGWHGAWWLEPLAEDLRRRGHRAFAVELTGVGERAHLNRQAINLDTQIEDAQRILDNHHLEDVVLFAHSYGGMIITPLADTQPERVRAMVYADAQVPEDGDSLWSLTNQESRDLFIAAAADGMHVEPPPGLDPRATSHPLGCFVQPVRVTGAYRQVDPRHYVYLNRWVPGLGSSPLRPFYEKLSGHSDWYTHEFDSSHDFMTDARPDMLRLLLSLADQNQSREAIDPAFPSPTTAETDGS